MSSSSGISVYYEGEVFGSLQKESDEQRGKRTGVLQGTGGLLRPAIKREDLISGLFNNIVDAKYSETVSFSEFGTISLPLSICDAGTKKEIVSGLVMIAAPKEPLNLNFREYYNSKYREPLGDLPVKTMDLLHFLISKDDGKFFQKLMTRFITSDISPLAMTVLSTLWESMPSDKQLRDRILKATEHVLEEVGKKPISLLEKSENEALLKTTVWFLDKNLDLLQKKYNALTYTSAASSSDNEPKQNKADIEAEMICLIKCIFSSLEILKTLGSKKGCNIFEPLFWLWNKNISIQKNKNIEKYEKIFTELAAPMISSNSTANTDGVTKDASDIFYLLLKHYAHSGIFSHHTHSEQVKLILSSYGEYAKGPHTYSLETIKNALRALSQSIAQSGEFNLEGDLAALLYVVNRHVLPLAKEERASDRRYYYPKADFSIDESSSTAPSPTPTGGSSSSDSK